MTCEIYPWLHVAPYYPSDVISTVPQYRVQFDNHIVEFNNSEASIFATYTLPGGEVRPYRAEYVSLKMLPVSESYRNAIGQLKYNHNISSWNTFIRDSPTRVRANMTMVDGLIIEVMFDEVFIALENKKTIKFSIFMHSTSAREQISAIDVYFAHSRLCRRKSPVAHTKSCGYSSKCSLCAQLPRTAQPTRWTPYSMSYYQQCAIQPLP